MACGTWPANTAWSAQEFTGALIAAVMHGFFTGRIPAGCQPEPRVRRTNVRCHQKANDRVHG